MWSGPYEVIEITSPVNCRIVHTKTKQTQHVHITRLKPFIARQKPTELPEDLRLDEALESSTPDSEEISDSPEPTPTIELLQEAVEAPPDAVPNDEIQNEDETHYKNRELYFIDKILDYRIRKAKKNTYRQYFIRWKGYGPEADSWEPASSFEYNMDPIREFHERTGLD